uniref:Uncharacterized protein n=1 Tax=Lepeophtheirus salmonis TaxID=72036 RepID=A0A0K2V767_LEPSM
MFYLIRNLFLFNFPNFDNISDGNFLFTLNLDFRKEKEKLTKTNSSYVKF